MRGKTVAQGMNGGMLDDPGVSTAPSDNRGIYSVDRALRLVTGKTRRLTENDGYRALSRYPPVPPAIPTVFSLSQENREISLFLNSEVCPGDHWKMKGICLPRERETESCWTGQAFCQPGIFGSQVK